MVEFGEKIKQLREEKGMTQQTMAEHLYVTRQAVSRWECGARYPDLITTKKIAEILEVTIDELVSGEELKRNIEKEPVLATPVPNITQSVIYAVGMLTYLLMCIFSGKILMPGSESAGTVTGGVSIIAISAIGANIADIAAYFIGFCASVKNQLSSKKIGMIMAVVYGVRGIQHIIPFLYSIIEENRATNMVGWAFAIYYLIAAAVVCTFFCIKSRISPVIVYFIASIEILEIGAAVVYVYFRMYLTALTDLGFVIMTVRVIGEVSFVMLLLYQAYMLDKKRRLAVKTD